MFKYILNFQKKCCFLRVFLAQTKGMNGLEAFNESFCFKPPLDGGAEDVVLWLWCCSSYLGSKQLLWWLVCAYWWVYRWTGLSFVFLFWRFKRKVLGTSQQLLPSKDSQRAFASEREKSCCLQRTRFRGRLLAMLRFVLPVASHPTTTTAAVRMWGAQGVRVYDVALKPTLESKLNIRGPRTPSCLSCCRFFPPTSKDWFHWKKNEAHWEKYP